MTVGENEFAPPGVRPFSVGGGTLELAGAEVLVEVLVAGGVVLPGVSPLSLPHAVNVAIPASAIPPITSAHLRATSLMNSAPQKEKVQAWIP